nr:hypothetical protein [Tanacetum cinerariifolium]
MDEGFTATAYLKVQENLKLTVEEQVLLEEPASSSGTLSSLKHLSKDLSFGDLFFSDKPLEADNDKATAETEVKSMVIVTIQQDMSSIPPMTSLIIDLTSRPESPKDMALDEQAQSSDDEDIESAYIPKRRHLHIKVQRHVTIQSDFFFNKDLEYLRYGCKGSIPALSISKMKAAYYPDVGLEQMVPDQIWIVEECKYDIAAMYFQRQRFYIDRHTSEGDRSAVRTHMRILSVVRIENETSEDVPAKEPQVDADMQRALEESLKSMYDVKEPHVDAKEPQVDPPVVIRKPESG